MVVLQIVIRSSSEHKMVPAEKCSEGTDENLNMSDLSFSDSVDTACLGNGRDMGVDSLIPSTLVFRSLPNSNSQPRLVHPPISTTDVRNPGLTSITIGRRWSFQRSGSRYSLI